MIYLTLWYACGFLANYIFDKGMQKELDTKPFYRISYLLLSFGGPIYLLAVLIVGTFENWWKIPDNKFFNWFTDPMFPNKKSNSTSEK